jgi:hypothetical protein
MGPDAVTLCEAWQQALLAAGKDGQLMFDVLASDS